MKVLLESITSTDPRSTAELTRGEIVPHQVSVSVEDLAPRTFSVFVKANVLPGMDASLVYGDALLEELLRFEPAALNRLYSMVGRYRRGLKPSLPVLLVDASVKAACGSRQVHTPERPRHLNDPLRAHPGRKAHPRHSAVAVRLPLNPARPACQSAGSRKRSPAKTGADRNPHASEWPGA